jgi:hypothetical protein
VADHRERGIWLDPPEPVPVEPPHDPLVAATAEAVRALYVANYREFRGDPHYGREPIPQWDGGENQFGRRCQPIWPKIAKKFVEIGADPISFIRALFWNRGADNKPFAPTYLLSTEAVARYRTYQLQVTEDARNDCQRDLQTVQGEVRFVMRGLSWEYQRALRYVLLNKTIRVSTIVRYCLAAKEGLHEVTARFHDQALLQYVFQQDILNVACGELIPASFRQEGEQARRRILGRA